MSQASSAWRIFRTAILILAAAASAAWAGAASSIFNHGFESGGICGWSTALGAETACPYDFSCAGNAAPTSAVDPVVVSGTLSDVLSGGAISGALIEARRRSDDVVLDSDTTAMNGSFSLSVVTAGLPIDAYLLMTLANYPPTYVFPPDPLFADLANQPARAITSAGLSLAYFLAVGGSQSPGTGTTAVAVIDCAGTPIAGATAAFAPPAGALRYVAGNVPSQSANSTDSSGLVLGMNAAPGDPTVSALYAQIALRSHSFRSTSGAVTFTLIHP